MFKGEAFFPYQILKNNFIYCIGTQHNAPEEGNWKSYKYASLRFQVFQKKNLKIKLIKLTPYKTNVCFKLRGNFNVQQYFVL